MNYYKATALRIHKYIEELEANTSTQSKQPEIAGSGGLMTGFLNDKLFNI